MLTVALLLAAGGLFLVGLAAVVYVAYRFLALALSMDMAMLREFRVQANASEKAAQSAGPVLGDRLREFISSRMAPTEGEFVPTSDEEMFIQEQVEHLRRQGLTEEELEAFMRQAVGTDIGKPE